MVGVKRKLLLAHGSGADEADAAKAGPGGALAGRGQGQGDGAAAAVSGEGAPGLQRRASDKYKRVLEHLSPQLLSQLAYLAARHGDTSSMQALMQLLHLVRSNSSSAQPSASAAGANGSGAAAASMAAGTRR